MSPLIFSVGVGDRFPSVKDCVIEVLRDGTLIVIVEEIADVWCIAKSVLENVLRQFSHSVPSGEG